MFSGVFLNIKKSIIKQFKNSGIEIIEIEDKKFIPDDSKFLVLNYDEDVFSICHAVKKKSKDIFILVLKDKHDKIESITREEKKWFKADIVINLPINELQIKHILETIYD